ncbi:MAG: hypothetical protein ABJC66_12560 [Gammaproteobacteria bacterium]
MFTVITVLVVFGAVLLFTSINVLPEYQRAVVLTLGHTNRDRICCAIPAAVARCP